MNGLLCSKNLEKHRSGCSLLLRPGPRTLGTRLYGMELWAPLQSSVFAKGGLGVRSEGGALGVSGPGAVARTSLVRQGL